MTNRLADSTSPYLQQHKDNPVDWWPWCDEAFAEAKQRDVPVFLSIGYAACHWCHVMAHESFEDDGIAKILNSNFVSIKVDREERPDVDAVYMSAVQGLTGHGGWPMTVFLNAERQPFYAGTYFPREARGGMPTFQQVLAGVTDAWVTRRSEVDAGAAKITDSLIAQQAAMEPDDQVLDRVALERTTDLAVQRLAHDFDPVNAGFGTAPKFPPSTVVEFLLRHGRRTGSREAKAMADETCDAMARGGLYDQLAGGFARYSVDAKWVVPHFEKMLYDNALLLRVYAHWYAATGSDLGRRVAFETADFLLRELRTSEGGFASSLDADAAAELGGVAHEGTSYVWTPEQLIEVLGLEDAARASALFTVTANGTFEEGASVLQLRKDPAEVPELQDVLDPVAEWRSIRRKLLAARDQRPQPARDDKVVAAWNGLAIAALADAGDLLNQPQLIAAARDAAVLLRDVHVVRGSTGNTELARTSRDGRVTPNAPGVLEDYGCVAEGLLALYAVTAEQEWFELAGSILDTVLADFGKGDGGFYDTSARGEQLIVRSSDPTDLAAPGGWSAATNALLTYGTLAASEQHVRAGESGLRMAVRLGSKAPRFAGWLMAASEAYLDGPFEVIVVGAPNNAAAEELRRVAVATLRPGISVVSGQPDPQATSGPFAARPMVDGGATAYVCRGSHCYPPVQTVDALQALLR